MALQKGKIDEAKKAIAEALQSKNQRRANLYHAGMIEKDSGNNRKEAKKICETALEIIRLFDLLQAEKAHRALEELK